MRQPLFTFNRGVVSPLALARVDQKRVAISAEEMTNWIPRVLGPMSLRPGLEYITNTLGNKQARYLPFIFSTTDTALLEFTDLAMRVIIDDIPLTRQTVTATVTNPNFTTDVVGWTDNSDAGGAIAWAAGGYMAITGDGDEAFGIADQSVAVIQSGTEHALRVVVERGPVVFKVGSSQGDDDYVSETSLATGVHSLSFSPIATFHIRMMSALERTVQVDSCTVELAGIVEIPTPWATSKLSLIRHDQSGDVIFAACSGIKQQKIERRTLRSWSVVDYLPENGPYRIENISPITIASSTLTGDTTLTASKDLFKATNIGSLYRLESQGQTVTDTNIDASATDVFTDPIEVVGITSDRIFTIVVGTLTGSGSTVTLQRSLESDTGPWADVPGLTWTADITRTYDDGLDNQIVWYRIGIKNADYVGPAQTDVELTINTGTITGVVRVTGFTSETVVSGVILSTLGGTDATEFWAEGLWSDRRGWPSAVSLHEGRLWWAGKDKIIGSISDSFDSFDPAFEGDAGPINRSIGSGPVDNITWAMSLQRLILGGDGAEHSVRSSSFDEPITPTNFMMRDASTQGSKAAPGVKVDQRGIYIQKSGLRIYEIAFESQIDYDSRDLTLLVPEFGKPGLVRLAIQRQPDTRIHALRSDGTAMLGVYDKVEEVLAWIKVETDGQIEDVVVLPGDDEDDVYYSVRRTINGGTVLFLEKWAKEDECRGGLLNKQADAMLVYDGAATTTVTGLSHLERENVVVWADGVDVGTQDDYTQTYTVIGGQITLPTAASQVVVGLPYTAQFKSAKLGAQGDSFITALNIHKRIQRLGMTMAWVHPKGVRFGPDFTNLDSMPEVEAGVTIDPDTIRETYVEHEIIFPGTWETDTRVCLQAQAPRPVTVLAGVPNMDVGG